MKLYRFAQRWGILGLFLFSQLSIIPECPSVEAVHMVADICPPIPEDQLDDIHQNMGPVNLVADGDRLFFVADDGVHGGELWVSDGTTSGTRLVMDYFEGPRWGAPAAPNVGWLSTENFPTDICVSKGNAYFPVITMFGSQLWRSDGTAEGSQYLLNGMDLPFGVWPLEITDMGEYVLFSAESEDDGRVLWRSDGTPEGTRPLVDPLADLQPLCSIISYGVMNPYIRESFNRVGDLLFFRSTGMELWRSDGTVEGTFRLADRSTCHISNMISNRRVAFKGKHWFVAYQEGYGQELWHSDGTPEGTKMFADIDPETEYYRAPGTIAAAGDGLFAFYPTARDDVAGQNLYWTDGAPENIQFVKQFRRPPDSGAGLNSFTEFQGHLYFSIEAVENPSPRSRLWRSDGTPEGTFMVAPEFHGTSNLRVCAGSLYFLAFEHGGGQGLYRTDGTREGTVRVRSFDNRLLGGFLMQNAWLREAGDKLFFVANDDIHGYELWVVERHDVDDDGIRDDHEAADSQRLFSTEATWTHLLLADSDSDGLLDGEEANRGEADGYRKVRVATNPRLADTDGDGFMDGVEVLLLGTDPLDPDSPDPNDPNYADRDGDGLPALIDPDDTSWDADGNLFHDAWEALHAARLDAGGPVTIPGDVNGDGQSNNQDAIMIFNWTLDNIPTLPCPSQADFVADGFINNLDAVACFNRSLGLGQPLPIYP